MRVMEMKLNHATKAELEEREQLIRECEEELARRKRSRNSLMPVSRLPTELLLKIIAIAWGDCASSRPMFLLHVSHVCWLWRMVALDTPALWARVGLANPRHVKLMLKRSKGVPLTVCGEVKTYAYSGKREREAFLVALRKLQRIRELDLRILDPPHDDGTRPRKLRKQVLHQLVSLTVADETFYSDKVFATWLPELDCPSLQHLSVSRWAITRRGYGKLLRPSLLSLSMDRDHIEFSDLVVLLENLPQLQSLTLKECFQRPRSALTPVLRGPTRKATMRRLESLVLVDTLLHCSTLFVHLDIPAAINIEMVLSSFTCKHSYSHNGRRVDEEVPLSDVVESITTLAQGVFNESSQVKLAIADRTRDMSDYYSHYSRGVDDVDARRWQDYVAWAAEGPRMLISVFNGTHSSEYGEADSGDVKEALVRSLAEPDLKYLQVDPTSGMKAGHWKRRFGHLVNVTRLWVARADHEFLDALSIQGAASQQEGMDRPAPLFPRLEYLTIEDISPHAGEDFPSRLAVALESRERKLAHLDIRGVTGWPSEDVAQLSDIVVKLTIAPPANAINTHGYEYDEKTQLYAEAPPDSSWSEAELSDREDDVDERDLYLED
ncbi:hypothetical protein GLOTRDRAFT_128737 [Gloeophyllum trabeum ATCC 11539]|uniref:F-box domain-containing protein n=1 Tax=Gloeophyllum trabeum (strain ATCC 11539 / FP-39264 / Madison 617) TaxID=670483 RepID=S7Q649_GLOTA|nr:uncharacterized protein GLOTRDRAFT_128737 [Gloeophyllum trabeum ATCC 11539]EPQ55506.1 hypothetical protein GLOTRDRAFT_128737 [Gloeophyllum trabeum ATCC 11539]